MWSCQMKITRGFAALAMLMATVTAASGANMAAADAAVTITCTAAQAPSISGSAGVVTAHYYHSCNTIAGMSEMDGTITIFNTTTGLGYGRSVVSGTPQTTAAGTVSDTIADLGHGTFYAQEDLWLYGTFMYGSVPGCGRESDTLVHCKWITASHYY
jgi:hypothetical protein